MHGSILEDEQEYFRETQVQDQDLVLDDNILTAQGYVFSKFAVEIAQWFGVLTKKEDIDSTLDWFRYS